MNSVNLIGRLTKDPELQDRSGTQVGRLRLAVPRMRADDGADFVDVVVFNNQAAVCNDYLAKGRRVAVEGRLHYHEWKAEDGSTRSRHEVIAQRVQFLDRKPAETPEPAAEPETAEAAA